MINKSTFAEILKKHRRIKGISQDGMVTKIDISQTHYSRIERGEVMPKDKYIKRMVEILGEAFLAEIQSHGFTYQESLLKQMGNQLKSAKFRNRVLAGLLILFFFTVLPEIIEGFMIGAGPDPVRDFLLGLPPFALVGGLITWYYWPRKAKGGE